MTQKKKDIENITVCVTTTTTSTITAAKFRGKMYLKMYFNYPSKELWLNYSCSRLERKCWHYMCTSAH